MNLLLILATMTQVHNPEIMRLIDTKTGYVIIEFEENHVRFLNWFLEKELTNEGIFVPPFLSEEFEGKKAIFPNDPLFEKAFVEIYCRFSLTDPSYQWVKESVQDSL